MSKSKIKSLAKDTAIYGLSSIVGRFLNWMLVPFYTFVFSEVELGIIQNIYAYVAFGIIILTFGMETTFFRYVNKQLDEENSYKIYSTIIIFISSICLLFLALVFLFINPISQMMDYEQQKSYLLIMAITVAFDAFIAIPFAFIRYKKRPYKFATLKIIQIGLNISLNLFFLLLCPKIFSSSYSYLISSFFDPNSLLLYTFLANMISSIFITILLFPNLLGFKYRFDTVSFKSMLKYTLPLVLLGLVGILNQTVDKLLYPSLLFKSREEGFYWLGVYTAGAKVAVVMTMFTQAFRFAYEPFVFAENKDKDAREMYSKSMTYFVLFALIILIAISYYLDILKFIISPKFFDGLKVVPLIMIGELFFGVYFNLSIWFKLTDKTIYGAYFSIIGTILIVGINIVFVPIFGIIASAWANLACYLGMSIISYFIGRKYYPINYQIRKLLIYGVISYLFYLVGMNAPIENQTYKLLFRSLLLIIFILIIIKRELGLDIIRHLNRFKKKN